jgi:hypothetical protein
MGDGEEGRPVSWGRRLSGIAASPWGSGLRESKGPVACEPRALVR